MLVNSKNKIRKIWNDLELYYNKKGCESPKRAAITSDDKNNITYGDISEKESLESVELIFTTTLLEVGVNINMDCGIDFIFDYTDTVCHTDAKNALQLIYRHRKRDTRVYCFAKMFEANNILTQTLESSKSIIPLEEILNSNEYISELERQQFLSSITFNNLDIESKNENDLSAMVIKELTKELESFEKQLGAFLILADNHGCQILFDFYGNDEKIDTTPSKLNDFVINMLNNLIALNTDTKIKIEAIIDSDYTNSVAHEDFKIESTETGKEHIIVNAKYHSVYNSIVRRIVFQFNYLKIFYGDDIKKVFNFIFNNYTDTNFSTKIDCYIRAHRCLAKEQRIVASLIEEKYQENLKYDRTQKTLLEYELKDELSSLLKKKLLEEMNERLDSALIEKVYSYFDEYLNDYLLDEIEKTLGDMFKLNKNNGYYEFEKKYVLDFYSKYDTDCGDTVDNSIIEAFMVVSNSSFSPSSENTLNNNLITESSRSYSDKELYKRRLKLDIDGGYTNGDVTYYIKHDYFSANTYINKDDITLEYLWNEFGDKLNQFKNRQENKRATKCYISICLKTKEIIIAKSKKNLFEMLSSNGTLEAMHTKTHNKDFTKKNIFNKYYKDCVNFYVTQIDL